MKTFMILILALSLSACQSGQKQERGDYSQRRGSELFQIADGPSAKEVANIKRFKKEPKISRVGKASESVVIRKQPRYLDITPMQNSSYKYISNKATVLKNRPVAELPVMKNVPILSKKDVQYLLKKLGYYKGKLDGDFGKKTIAAIKAFQSDTRLKTDGIAGKRTKAQLVTQVRNKLQMNYQSATRTN